MRLTPESFAKPLLIALLAGCAPAVVAPVDVGPKFTSRPVLTTPVWGLAFSPETMWRAGAACGPDCPVPYLVSMQNPGFAQALVPGAQVALTDARSLQPVVRASAPADAEGNWVVRGLRREQAPVVYVEGQAPGASYLPTVTEIPVDSDYSFCVLAQATLLRTDGVLAAVAEHLAPGRPASAQALLDSPEWSGAAVVVPYRPAPLVFLAPAGGLTLQADGARVFGIEVAVTPGAAGQPPTTRFTVSEGPHSASGIFVLLRPLASTAEQAHFQLADGVHSADEGRPWTAAPGTVTFVRGKAVYAPQRLRMQDGSDGQPPLLLPYLCRPEFADH